MDNAEKRQKLIDDILIVAGFRIKQLKKDHFNFYIPRYEQKLYKWLQADHDLRKKSRDPRISEASWQEYQEDLEKNSELINEHLSSYASISTLLDRPDQGLLDIHAKRVSNADSDYANTYYRDDFLCYAKAELQESLSPYQVLIGHLRDGLGQSENQQVFDLWCEHCLLSQPSVDNITPENIRLLSQAIFLQFKLNSMDMSEKDRSDTLRTAFQQVIPPKKNSL